MHNMEKIHLYDKILSPLLTEKTTNLSSQNKIVFKVPYAANKKNLKLNIEKIGNMVSQLHIHVIARSKKDSSWPLSVWVVKGKIYTKTALSVMMQKVRIAFK